MHRKAFERTYIHHKLDQASGIETCNHEICRIEIVSQSSPQLVVSF